MERGIVKTMEDTGYNALDFNVRDATWFLGETIKSCLRSVQISLNGKTIIRVNPIVKTSNA